MKIKITYSIILIIISIIFTIISFLYPEIYIFSINDVFLNKGLYHIYFIQFFTGTFLHIGIFHLLINCIFLYIFGDIIEKIIGKKKFIVFFLFATIFNGIIISYISIGNTVGISGFCMALISYYTLELKSKNNPEYKGGVTAIIINIIIGFIPGISLIGHLFGAIAGILYFYYNKNYFKEKFVGNYKKT